MRPKTSLLSNQITIGYRMKANSLAGPRMKHVSCGCLNGNKDIVAWFVALLSRISPNDSAATISSREISLKILLAD